MAKTINLGKVGLTFEGDYDSSKNYASRTCVFYNHVSWASKKDVPAGIAPGTNEEYWQKVSERGAQGIQGERGPQGNSAFDGTGVEIVNDLTKGGEAAVLSAEQGKILKQELTELESEARELNMQFGIANILTTAGIIYNKDSWEKSSDKLLLRASNKYSIAIKGMMSFDNSVSGYGVQLTYEDVNGKIDSKYSKTEIIESTLYITPLIDTYVYFRAKGYVSGKATAEIVRISGTVPIRLESLDDIANNNLQEIKKLNKNVLADNGVLIDAPLVKIGAIASEGNATSWEDYKRSDLIDVKAGDIVVANVIATSSVSVMAKYNGSNTFFDTLLVGTDSSEKEYALFIHEDMKIVISSYEGVSNYYVKVFRNAISDSYSSILDKNNAKNKENAILFAFDGLKNAQEIDVQIAIEDSRLNSIGGAVSEKGYSVSAPIALNREEEIVFEFFGARNQYICAIGLCDEAGKGLGVATMSTETIRIDFSDNRSAFAYYTASEDCYVRLCRYDFNKNTKAYKAYTRASETKRELKEITKTIDADRIVLKDDYSGEGKPITLFKDSIEQYPRTKADYVDGLSDKLSHYIPSTINEDNTGYVQWGNLSNAAQQIIKNLVGSSAEGGGLNFIPSSGDFVFEDVADINYLKLDSRKNNPSLQVLYDYEQIDLKNLFTYESALYVIRFSHSATSEIISIPKNSTILFLGGSIKGNLAFDNTLLLGNVNIKGSIITGSIANPMAEASWLCHIDGVSDDARNLEMLSDVCNSIYMRDGEYRLISTSDKYNTRPIHICLSDGCKLLGGLGARLITSKESCVLGLIGVNDVSIQGISIVVENDGSTLSTKVDGWENITHESLHSIFIRDSKDVRISNVNLNGIWADGILVGTDFNTGYSENILIEKCEMTAPTLNNRNGVSIESAKRVWVIDNYIHDMTADTMPGAIDIEPFKPTHVVDSIFVKENICENIGGNTGAIGIVANSDTVKNIFVDNNIVKGSYCGLFIKAFTSGSCKNIIMVNNIVEDETILNHFENEDMVSELLFEKNLNS